MKYVLKQMNLNSIHIIIRFLRSGNIKIYQLNYKNPINHLLDYLKVIHLVVKVEEIKKIHKIKYKVI